MSSLWTPDGERPIRREPEPPSRPQSMGGGQGQPTEEELAAMDEQLRVMTEEIVSVPAEAIVANHAVGLFQLAAAHLQVSPANLDDARLAIDALALLVDGLKGRLTDMETLTGALAQIRMAYVQVASEQGA
jgi:MoxR-like ATPase